MTSTLGKKTSQASLLWYDMLPSFCVISASSEALKVDVIDYYGTVLIFSFIFFMWNAAIIAYCRPNYLFQHSIGVIAIQIIRFLEPGRICHHWIAVHCVCRWNGGHCSFLVV